MIRRLVLAILSLMVFAGCLHNRTGAAGQFIGFVVENQSWQNINVRILQSGVKVTSRHQIVANDRAFWCEPSGSLSGVGRTFVEVDPIQGPSRFRFEFHRIPVGGDIVHLVIRNMDPSSTVMDITAVGHVRPVCPNQGGVE